MIPAHDGLVDNRITRDAAAAMPLARLVEFPGAGHELLREAAPVRAAVLAQALAFLQDGT
jgi:alpha-beta hydrolase superfamily lysophospholipase